MILQFVVDSKKYQIDTSKPLNTSIPLDFCGDQPNAFGAPKANAAAVETGQFIGDTRRGGSCNFERYTFIPHCNGTHTECVGHLSHERISIHELLNQSFFPATLISVSPEKASDTIETYLPDKGGTDLLITQKGLSESLKAAVPGFIEALLIRTLPNDNSKLTRDYMNVPPPFFSIEAMEYIVRLNVRHILVDIPSLDRTFDEGLLTAHRLFWNIPPKTHELEPGNYSPKTVTEMIFVPDEIKDGLYILDLQVANFVADASPSNPAIYRVT